jgi:hypothetical protein
VLIHLKAFCHAFHPANEVVREGVIPRFHALRHRFTSRLKQALVISEELLNGIDSRELLKRIETADADANIRQSDLTQALDRVDRLQVKIGVRPLVLTYNRDRRRLFLADRSFLFYRQYGRPTWPWEKDDSLAAALRAAPDGEQLVLDDFPLSDKALEDLADALELESGQTPTE